MGDRGKFFGNAEICLRTPKKVVQKFRQKFGPPVPEVLDPLVHRNTEFNYPIYHIVDTEFIYFLSMMLASREIIFGTLQLKVI